MPVRLSVRIIWQACEFNPGGGWAQCMTVNAKLPTDTEYDMHDQIRSAKVADLLQALNPDQLR